MEVDSFVVAILVFVLLCTVALDVTFGVLWKQAKDSSSSVSFNYCPMRPSCINTAKDYLYYMDSTIDDDGYFGPACVAPNMMGRMVAISHTSLSGFYSGDPAKWNPTTIANYGRIAFALTPDMLARLLPLGKFDATKIVLELGYPEDFVCGTAALNYTDCEYRLIIWTAPCPDGASAITSAYWENLEPFLRNFIYKDKTPNLQPAIQTISKYAGLLQNYTGCDPIILNKAPFNVTNQQLAGCSTAFMNAMQLFAGSKCTCPVPTCTAYNTTDNCTAENIFLSLATPTVEQFRAYLMSFEAFNAYFTGYGYTAASDYYDPLAGECWFPNSQISDLGENVAIVRIFNQTACGNNCTF